MSQAPRRNTLYIREFYISNYFKFQTQDVPKIHVCCIQFNALSNRIRFQTGFKLESIHVDVNSLNASVMSQTARRTLYIYVEFHISDYLHAIKNSRRRMFPKFTYTILCSFERYKFTFRLGLNQNRFTLTLNNARYEVREILRNNCNLAT